jgi:nucleoside-diphosphate-sugar epimerase
VASLLEEGHTVTAVDRKPVGDWQQAFGDVKNVVADLSDPGIAKRVVRGADVVYQLAADMGGMGFIEPNKALCMLSVLTSTNMLVAARDAGVHRFFYSSSACVYNLDKQRSPKVAPLKESDAYPAMAEDGYGWEKLFTERMCRHFREDFGLATRIARYHNVYGTHGAWEGGREKAPAAICRKVIEAKYRRTNRIVIWGDGEQTRSFMHIDDCVKGTKAILESGITEPLNLGSSELVTINQLVDMVEELAGVTLDRDYDMDAPRGVNGRNSDNSMIRQELGWEPSIRVRDGIAQTYAWVEREWQKKYSKSGRAA